LRTFFSFSVLIFWKKAVTIGTLHIVVRESRRKQGKNKTRNQQGGSFGG